MPPDDPGAATAPHDADRARFDLWVQRRLPAWQHLDALLPALEDAAPVSADTAVEVVRQYPEIARDLAIAQRAAPQGRVAGYLRSTYARLYQVLFREPRPPLADRAAAFRRDVAAVTAELRGYIAAVTAWFLLTALAGWWLVASYPELVTLFASEQMIETVQSGRLWTDDILNVAPSSVVSIRIFTNNIMVALTALSLGVFYGLGTLYIIGVNGLMLGGVFAFTARYGLSTRLFEFVCAHGFVELTIICIAGAIGLYIGEGLARPGLQTRVQTLQRRVARGGTLMTVCVAFLVGAGVIEGFVSPDAGFPLVVRMTVGIGYFLVFLWALTGFRRPGLRSAAATAAAGTTTAPAVPDHQAP